MIIIKKRIDLIKREEHPSLEQWLQAPCWLYSDLQAQVNSLPDALSTCKCYCKANVKRLWKKAKRRKTDTKSIQENMVLSFKKKRGGTGEAEEKGKFQELLDCWVQCVLSLILSNGFAWWLRGKESAWQRKGCVFDPWVRKIRWRRKWQPNTPVFLPGKPHGRRRLAGYRPWGHKRVGHHLATKQQPYVY